MKSSSIFTICRKNTEATVPADVELSGERIQIGLSVNDYNLYRKYSAIDETQTIVNSLIVLPALVYTFEELRQDGSEEVYKEKMWYVSLERAYRKKGINLHQVLLEGDKTSFECAQEAMELPITGALCCLDELFAYNEEECE